VRIGVYVDGFNLYYGARGICGRGTPGWRWLDLRALATSLARSHRNWPDVQMHRVVYCTARIDAATNPSGAHDQATYLNALAAADSVDLIEYGTYVSHVRTAPLATRDEQGRPQVVTPEWPGVVQDGRGERGPGGGGVGGGGGGGSRSPGRCSWSPTPTGRRRVPTSTWPRTCCSTCSASRW